MRHSQKCDPEDLGDVEAWVNLAPVWTTRILAKVFHPFRPDQIIAFSSTSIEGKAGSENEKDIEIVANLRDGENWAFNYGKKFDLPVTMLRPTLIYGGPRNQNVNLIDRIVRIFRLFPLVGDGKGLRQPVHARDLAECVVKVLDRNDNRGGIYNLGGSEMLTYREMVSRIFEAAGQTPRFLTVSPGVATSVVSVVCKMPGLGFLNPEMMRRMEDDLVYEIKPAEQDFSFAPGKFQP